MFNLLRDQNGNTIPIVALKEPHDVDGSVASAQSQPIDGDFVKITAKGSDITWLIGTNPEALQTSNWLGWGDYIYQPIERGQKVAVFGGLANIATVG